MTATLPRPGYTVGTASAPASPLAAVRTGRWFVAHLALKGPLAPVTVGSLSQFESIFGPRQSYSSLYDCLDEYFGDGGIEAIISRVVGPAAVTASAKLTDESAGNSLLAKAKGPGEYGNSLKVAVTLNGGKTAFTIVVKEGATVLEESPELTTQAAAVAWGQNVSQYIEFSLEASALLPKTQEVTLAAGKDDRASITDANYREAMALFTKEMGPGQISQPGRTTSQAYIDTLAHAATNNRFALLDAPNSTTAATVTGAATALRGTNDTYGLMVARWPNIPGILPAIPREVPPSSAVAAFIARSDAVGNSPNKPAAGVQGGKSNRAISLAQPPYENAGKQGPEVTRDEMYSKGINLFMIDGTTVELYGWRTLTDPNGALQDWVNAGNARLRMAIVAKAGIIAKQFVLDEVDGLGQTIAEFNGELKAMLTEYFNKGLYGKTTEEALKVNTGPTVNTAATLANQELRAEIGLRMAPDAEMVQILIAKVPITQNLPS